MCHINDILVLSRLCFYDRLTQNLVCHLTGIQLISGRLPGGSGAGWSPLRLSTVNTKGRKKLARCPHHITLPGEIPERTSARHYTKKKVGEDKFFREQL